MEKKIIIIVIIIIIIIIIIIVVVVVVVVIVLKPLSPFSMGPTPDATLTSNAMTPTLG